MALLTVALSVGAHALAHGGAPSGAGAALVVLVAVTVGARAATGVHGGTAVLVSLLSAGQLLNHLVLAASGHSHSAGGAPAAGMVAAHVAAVLLGATLIAAGSRLYRALTRVMRVLTTASPHQPQCAGVDTTSDQPMLSLLLLAGSLSYRGPPVGASC